jgi:hypothetical protein
MREFDRRVCNASTRAESARIDTVSALGNRRDQPGMRPERAAQIGDLAAHEIMARAVAPIEQADGDISSFQVTVRLAHE